MSLETVPGQLDTLIGQLTSVQQRLDVGDARMNAADLARTQMNDKLDVHGLMMADQSKHLGEQDDKLDALGAAMAKLSTAMDANTAITTTVKDALTTARVGRVVLTWVSGVVAAIVGLWVAVAPLLHH